MSSRLSRLKPRSKPIDECYPTYQQLQEEEEEETFNTRDVSRQENVDNDDDDDDEPVWTFRVLLLGLLSFIFLIIITKYYLHETSECVVSMVWVMVFVYPIGFIMGKKLPKRKIYLRLIGLEFSLNPGYFNTKEYALISIIGNIGAVYGGLTSDFILNTSF
uniref:Putative oligopeptide transporter 2-like n=1 Tax=Solanum chacoense TaxID=4108 RepID=A0A0V0H9J6_SOLCH